jgi:hypothetical protein
MLHFIMRDKRLKAIDPLIRLEGGAHVPEERGCPCGADPPLLCVDHTDFNSQTGER